VRVVGWLGAQVVPSVDGVAYGLLLFLVAGGLTLGYGVGGVLNLAHGTVCAVGAYTAAVLCDGTWPGLAIAVAAGTAAGTGSGIVLAAMLAPVTDRGPLQQALLTVGVALVGGDLLATATGGNNLPVAPPSEVAGTVGMAGHRYPTYRLALIVVALAIAAAGYLALSYTRTGRLIRATVDDQEMVACLGISPARVRVGVLAVSGALAGFAGALGVPVIGAGPDTADTVLLLSVVVVVVGGLGSVAGALIAAIGVGEVQTLGVSALPDWVAPYLLYGSAAAALIIRSHPTMPRWQRPRGRVPVVDGGAA
jgi:branched-subunit amino acid ABC-type transport system permease component